jgi:thymidylate synthase
MNADETYLKMVKDILYTGTEKTDRTGTGTISLPFQQMRFDLTNNKIPLLTTKKMFTKGIIHEILWYLKGSTNIKYLVDNGVHIWDEWADENGELGPVYGAQWRNWTKYYKANPHDIPANPSDEYLESLGLDRDEWEYEVDTTQYYTKCDDDEGIDQVAEVVKKLRTNPTDRRIIISAWNVAEIPEMRLPPCHALFQFWSNGKGELSCHLYQRSCDTGLGVPFNIVQYSILTHMFAHVTGHVAREFVWTGGDVHIYNNHKTALVQQLIRDSYESPTLKLNPAVKEIDDFKYEDFEIVGYQHHPAIKMEVSV